MKDELIGSFLNFMGLKYLDKDNKKVIEDLLKEFSQIEMYKKEDVIFEEDTKAEKMFYLYSGSIKVVKFDEHKNEDTLLNLVYPEHLIGSVAAIGEDNYLFTSKANEDVYGLILEKEFLEYVYRDKNASSAFMRFILDQHKDTNQKMLDFITLNDEARVLKYLEDYRGKEIDLSKDKDTLATILSIKRTIFPKIITKLVGDGKLKRVNGKYIYL